MIFPNCLHSHLSFEGTEVLNGRFAGSGACLAYGAPYPLPLTSVRSGVGKAGWHHHKCSTRYK